MTFLRDRLYASLKLNFDSHHAVIAVQFMPWLFPQSRSFKSEMEFRIKVLLYLLIANPKHLSTILPDSDRLTRTTKLRVEITSVARFLQMVVCAIFPN